MSEVPLISFVLVTYNQERYVEEALDGAFAQDWPNLEIVVSDDCSTDATWDRIQRACERYRGPHRVVLNRNETNLDPMGNSIRGGELATSDWQVRGDGDDISEPHRVSRVAQCWRETGATLVSHDARRIDAAGDDLGLLAPEGSSAPLALEALCQKLWTTEMLGATYSWKRELIDVFGGYDRSLLPRGGDMVLPIRAALLSGMFYLHEPLIRWRTHDAQQTRETCDFTSSVAAQKETRASFDASALLTRISDLDRFGGWHPNRAHELEPARRHLEATLLRALNEWTPHRSAQEAAGHRLLWGRRRRSLSHG